MKKILVLITISLIFYGCKTVTESLYLRDAEVAGSLTTAPIYITDTTDIPSITISPTLSYNTQKTFTGNITEFTSSYRLDSSYVPLSTV